MCWYFCGGGERQILHLIVLDVTLRIVNSYKKNNNIQCYNQTGEIMEGKMEEKTPRGRLDNMGGQRGDLNGQKQTPVECHIT